jgi:hypothetical protein
MRHLFTIFFVGIALSCVAQSITPVQARKYMGKEVTVLRTGYQCSVHHTGAGEPHLSWFRKSFSLTKLSQW